MSSVPYIFANDYGNIPLSYLDANFANVKANVDHATTANLATVATSATSAGTVTASAQPVITSVGTLTSLTVSGNTVSGNAQITGTLTVGTIDVHNFVGDLRGSVYADDSTIMVDGIDNTISATTASFDTVAISGNVSAGNANITGNITTSNALINSTVTIGGLEVVVPVWTLVTANATANLSATTSYNMFYGNTTGLTLTLNMPVDPVEGQLTRIALSGDDITLALGTGNVSYSFAGLNQSGNVYAYIFRSIPEPRWVRTA